MVAITGIIETVSFNLKAQMISALLPHRTKKKLNTLLIQGKKEYAFMIGVMLGCFLMEDFCPES